MTIMGAYDRWAWAYDDLIRNRNPVVELSYDWVLEVVGEWRGRQVCDLGCGQGELARRMAQRGAIVTAVDHSPAILRVANSYCNPSGITYVWGDARDPDTLPKGPFDVVVMNLMLMDVDDFQRVFASAAVLVGAGGAAVWTVMHPCFQSPYSEPLEDEQGRLSHRRVSHYASQWWRSSRPGTLRAALGAYHRTLSDYVNSFVGAGFDIRLMAEPVVAKHVPLEPDQECHRYIPPILGVFDVKRR